jgi:hypothetical protein
MSVIEYQFLDPSADQARWTGSLNPSPLTLLGPFTFSFATPGLTTGVPLVTLPVGAVICGIGVSVPVAFDGTTPLADVGTFDGGNAGLFDTINSAAVDLTSADAAVTDNAGISQVQATGWLTSVGLPITAICTLSLVVSQDGTKGGTATGSTAGTGAVYVLVATPFTN